MLECRWERTEEPFFVEEEREARLESLFEADLEVGACCCEHLPLADMQDQTQKHQKLFQHLNSPS